MTIGEFIMNIRDRYKQSKDPEENQRAEDLYKKDFGFYSESKLEKVWYAVKRYHGTNFAPNYSNIVQCMDKAGIGESRDTGSNKFYQRCKTCGCKYAVNICVCPRCNKYLGFEDGSPKIFKNEIDIVKCESLPGDVIFTREACPICPIFRGATGYPKGIKCDSFNTDMSGKLPECEGCNCRDCCEDMGSKNESMTTGTLMGVVDGCVRKVKA
jgi:hypothetical protein